MKKNKIFKSLLDKLQASIHNGQLPPHAMLPSEHELCRQYKISRVSVRSALRELETQRLIYRQPGKGTFVADRCSSLPPVGERIIGIGVSDRFSGVQLGGAYHGPIFNGIQQVCQKIECRIEFIRDSALSSRAPDLLGFIGISYAQSAIQQLIEKHPKTPVVLVNRPPEKHPFHSVFVDHREWARRTLEYLIGLGHRRIGLVGMKPSTNFQRPRILGCQDAMRPAGIPWDPGLLLLVTDQKEWTERLTVFLKDRRMTAVFILLGNVLNQTLVAVREAGRSVPTDLSVAVFDDLPHLFQVWIPPLTSVHQPLEQLGRRAVEAIMRTCTGPTGARICERIPADLIIRESCARPLPVAGEIRVTETEIAKVIQR